jgi:hypothetical protein
MKLQRNFLGEWDTPYFLGWYTGIPMRCKKKQFEPRKSEVRGIICKMYEIPGAAGTRISVIQPISWP